jgi:hypothetical protein
MSKTASEIGLIVGGLAFAGVGALAYYGFLSFGLGAAGFSQMLGIGLTTALSGVGMALRPTPKPVATQGLLSFNNGPSPRRVIYGQFQTAGVNTFASFPPSQNLVITAQYLHLVYTLTEHEITSFDAVSIDGTIYNFGTDLIWNATSGLTGYWALTPANYAGGSPPSNDFYWGHVLFEFDAGKPANGAQPFPQLAAIESTWTSACLQKGCAKVHVVLRADSGWTAVFPSGQVPNFQFLVTGKKLIDPRIITAWQKSTLYPHFNYIVDNNNVLWIQQASAGSPASGTLRPPFESFSASPGHTLTDNTCTWICSSWSLGALYNGNTVAPNLFEARLLNDMWIPSVAYTTSTLGDWIIEAPTGYFHVLTTSGTSAAAHPTFATTVGATTTDGTAVWTCIGRSTHAINPSNSALCVYDYLQDTNAGMGASAASIDTASVIAAANVCEEQVITVINADITLAYENLYACDGMFDHSSARGNVLTSLCGSMAGWVVPPGDLWHVFAGAFVTPTVGLTDADMRAPIKGDFRLSKRDIANGVKGTFVPAFLPTNPAGALSLTQVPGTWQSQSFPAYQGNGLAGKQDFITEDGGQIIWQDVQFDFTTSLWMAQRLAKITLMRLRFQETLTLPCKLTAFQLEAGDTFYFTHARWGILGVSYEAQQCAIAMDQDKSGAPIVGIDIVARQVDPTIYEFQGPLSSSDFGEYSPFGITGVMSGTE